MAKDPYKYFRVEARELLEGLSQGVLALEKGGEGTETVTRLLRLAHTLKGAARIVKQPKIAELAHAVEGVLAPHREGRAGSISRAHIDELLRSLDAASGLVAALEPAPARGSGGGDSAAVESFENVRVEIRELDTLLGGLFEAHVKLTAARRRLEDLPRASDPAAAQRNLLAGLGELDRELEQARDRANQLRLMPASAIFASLARSARDAAESLGKPIEFHTSGGDNRLDANVLLALRDALLHAVRNAVAHGIESEAERAAGGKLPAGQLRLDVERRGHRIAFTCRDDGRGIDAEAVRRAAVARGWIAASDTAPDSNETVRLLLKGGMTTSATVTEVSGRGIGLDVLQTTVARLKGELSLASEAGRGTTIDLCVPISISSLTALVVDAGGVVASLPLDSVRETLRLKDGDIARSAEHDSVIVKGKVLPFLQLAGALGRSPAKTRGARAWSAVVVQAGSHAAAIGVDRLVGTSDIVIRPLPLLAGPIATVAGASLDAEGHPQLVLDPIGLVAAARAGRLARPADRGAPAQAIAPVLIIDDSLTTRMLEQSILESAGYQVALATSAEEALELARVRRFSLFVVDVEMPGMSGFDFVERTRADAALREIPAILVTSRGAAEDRRRGAQVGARAYIVKSEFDQGRLLEIVHGLIG